MQFCILSFCFCSLCLDVDDEYEDEEDQWEEGAEDILEKGEGMKGAVLTTFYHVNTACSLHTGVVHSLFSVC